MQCREDDGHSKALPYILHFIESRGISSLVDVGTGTGRAIRFLKSERPRLNVVGVEPVQALIDQGIEKEPGLREFYVRARGESLPFPDEHFDAACQCGVLHHVARPQVLVREMARVARKAVFLSDSNRFGQGHILARLIKLALYKAGLWGLANRIKTRGKGYSVSEGDGVSYSYSVYDSYDFLARWADEMILIPTEPLDERTRRSWLNPLITSGHVLLCAFRCLEGGESPPKGLDADETID